jgi:hypothetical protein
MLRFQICKETLLLHTILQIIAKKLATSIKLVVVEICGSEIEIGGIVDNRLHFLNDGLFKRISIDIEMRHQHTDQHNGAQQRDPS